MFDDTLNISPPPSFVMAKRVLSIILMLMGIIYVKGQDLTIESIDPANGSSITSFNFKLTFDFSEIIKANGEGEYGIGWVGFHNDKIPSNEKSVTLYEGTKEDGIVLGRLCTSNYNGKTAGFTPTNVIDLNFEGAVPKSGVKYTIVITNQFKVYTIESGAGAIANSTLDCFKTPIEYEFVGGQASAESVNLASCSLSPGQALESIENIDYTFSVPVVVNNSNPIIIKDGETVVATSHSANVSEDGLTVTYSFNDAILYKNHSYSVVLPANAVNSVSDSNSGNDEFSVNVNGLSVNYFTLASSSPAQESTDIFSTVRGKFNVPTGMSIYKKDGVKCDLSAKLYINSLSEDNLIGTLSGVGENDIVTWTNTFSLEPSAKYIIYVPKGQFPLYNLSEEKYDYESGNDEVMIIIFSPSVEDSKLPPMEFQEPEMVQGKDSAPLTPGQSVSFLANVQIALKDLKYHFSGRTATFWVTPESKYRLYNITGGSEILVKEGVIGLVVKETDTEYYSVLNLPVNQTLFEENKYKLVIAEGELTVSANLIQNYVKNSEWRIELEGATPRETKLISCTLQDNAELSSLPIIIWEFSGVYVQNPELSAMLNSSYEFKGQPVTDSVNIRTLVTNTNTSTKIAMLNYDGLTGEPRSLNSTWSYEVVLPEGIIYYPTDPDIKNPEMRYTIIPVEKKPDVVEPEFINLSVAVNGLASASSVAVKGEPATITLSPSEDWKVVALTRDGNDVIDFVEDGAYTTPALADNTAIEATVEYDGAWAVEISTNVWQIKESNISIYSEDQKIVVSGVTPENTIMVYGVNGILINSVKATEGMDEVLISVSSGQTYIVVVDGKAAKIQM